MEFLKKKTQEPQEMGERILSLSVEDIVPNPNQPRKIFSEEELLGLAESIAEIGVLQPLTVRKVGEQWELIAGERRLRASQLAGLCDVPCRVMDVEQEESSVLALVENIQRQDLDYFEEAHAIANLISLYGLSQEEVSKKLGKSQSAVANTLRLLRLSDPVVEKLRLGACTQRHARALLKLQESEQQLEVLDKVVEQQLNVAQTEAYIQEYLTPVEEKTDEKKGKKIVIIRDVRLFLNTITRSLKTMKIAGVNAQCERQESQEEILLTIRIPNKVGEKNQIAMVSGSDGMGENESGDSKSTVINSTEMVAMSAVSSV